MALTRRCPASLAGRRALAPRIWGGRAHALIGYPGLRPTSPRTPGRGPARPFHGPLRETRNGHTPVTRAVRLYTLDKSRLCLSVRSKFRMARRCNSVLRSKVYLHNSSQHRCLLAASDRAPKLAPRVTRGATGPSAEAARRPATTSSAHVSSPGSHAFAHGTPHTEHGAHAPMNTPNEHPHGCHTSAHPIPSSLAAAAHA